MPAPKWSSRSSPATSAERPCPTIPRIIAVLLPVCEELRSRLYLFMFIGVHE